MKCLFAVGTCKPLTI